MHHIYIRIVWKSLSICQLNLANIYLIKNLCGNFLNYFGENIYFNSILRVLVYLLKHFDFFASAMYTYVW